jgi:hypothetical protein
MCDCYPILKIIREDVGSDSIAMYDPGPGGVARHAIGPAPSMTSCVRLNNNTAQTVGATFDVNGYITQLFNNSAFMFPSTMTFAAWNGTSNAWFWGASVGNFTSGLMCFNLSGSLLLFSSTSQFSPRNTYGFACNSSGHLVMISGASVEIRNQSNGLVASASTPNNVGYGDTCCVDGSDNVFVTTNSYVRKYNSSLTAQWTVSLALTHLACVADSSGAVFVFSNNSGTGQIRKYNSSGTLQWTVSLSGGFDGTGRDFDVWCDGSNIYFSGKISGSTIVYERRKWDGSGNLVWSEELWWNVAWGVGGLGAPITPSIRGNGTVIALASRRAS